jgi:hypothetical protein
MREGFDARGFKRAFSSFRFVRLRGVLRMLCERTAQILHE